MLSAKLGCSLLNGYRGEVTPGSFILVAWETVLAMDNEKYFDMNHRDTGLIFGDDLFIGIMAKVLNVNYFGRFASIILAGFCHQPRLVV